MWEGLGSKDGYLGTKGWMSSIKEEAAVMPGSDSRHATSTGGEVVVLCMTRLGG